MSAQDPFSAELAAWLAVEAHAPVPPSALHRALEATSTRRPRPSLVAGVASHWIGTVRTDAPGRVAVRAPLTARQLVIVTLLALLAVALAGAAILVGGGLERGPAPQIRQGWAGPVHDPIAYEDRSEWTDPRDAPSDWLDVTHVQASLGRWNLELAGLPPRATGLDAEDTVISYGLVFETTGDDRADYVVGISNEAPVRGDYRVWVTDLATGETEEHVGPPYGSPVDFRYPDGAGPGDDPALSRTMTFWFLGSEPPGLKKRSRFYAWTALARDGETVAWDYAPDAAWLAIPGALSVPRSTPSLAASPAPTSMAAGYGSPRLPGTNASPAGEYGWEGGPGMVGGMHRVILDRQGSRAATAMLFSVGADCLSASPGATTSGDQAAVPVRLAGFDGRAIEPYMPPVTFGRLDGDEITRAYELAVGDRTLCLWLTWHATTTDEERDAAMRILDTLRVEAIGDSRIRLTFTLEAGWDTG